MVSAPAKLDLGLRSQWSEPSLNTLQQQGAWTVMIANTASALPKEILPLLAASLQISTFTSEDESEGGRWEIQLY